MTTKKKITKKKATKKKLSKKVADARAKRANLVKDVKPIGRPSEYDPRFCEVIIEKMSEGFSKEAVAGYIGISKDTLYQWAKKHKEFSDAISIGETKSQLHWETDLVKYKVHTKNGKQINGQVFNLNMKNRFGWKDKQEVSVEDETKKAFGFALDEDPNKVDK